MALENVTGNLLAYKELEPGTFQHVDQLTTEQRTNYKLRGQIFHTADGELYTVQKKMTLWAITREPQNLVLRNIDEAYKQLTGQGNYFPDAEAAMTSLDHNDTVVVDLEGLNLVKDDYYDYGYFVVNPKDVKKLNSEQRKAAQRIYGPDEENFGLNMEMFSEAGKNPYVFVLMPNYVQSELRSNGKEFLGRASWLGSFDGNFNANLRCVDLHLALRGVRRVVREADALKSNEVPQAPQETERVKSPTMEEILAVSKLHVSPFGWEQFQAEIGKLYRP